MQKKAATVRAPGSFEQYLADIRDRTTALERFTDRATSLDERIDVSNLLLIEILKALAKEIEIHLPEYPKEGAAETTGYAIKSYPMDTARVSPGEEIRIQGDTIVAYTDDLAGCFIRVNSPVGDPIPLSAFNPYTHPGSFNSLWLETPAQPGMTITLLIGRAGAQAMAQTVRTIITAQLANIDVDIVAQSVGNIGIDIASQSVGNLSIDIATQSVGNIGINILACDLGLLNINLSAQSVPINTNIVASEVLSVNANITAQDIESINVNIASQALSALNVSIVAASAVVDFNIKSQAVTLNINHTGQTKGILATTDWATKQAADFHLYGTAVIAAGVTTTLITLTLVDDAEHWLYSVHISGTRGGLGRVRANHTAGHDELAAGYFAYMGGDNSQGWMKSWLAPVKRRRDVAGGITEITVAVTNTNGTSGTYVATLDGLLVADYAYSDQTYTLQADWQACATLTDVDLVASPGDVIPAEVP